MTPQEIKQRIVSALTEAGISVPTSGHTEYDDSTSLVSIYPEDRWIDSLDGECCIAIFADRVEKRQRNAPFNFNSGRCLSSQSYSSIVGMVQEVQNYSQARKAACWGS